MEKPTRLLSSQFFLKNSVFEVTLNRSHLAWKELPTKKKRISGSLQHPFKVGSFHCVPVSEIIAVQELEIDSGTKDEGRWQKMAQKPTEVYLYAFTVSYVERMRQHRWRCVDVTFQCPDGALCQQWLQTIREQLSLLTSRPKHLLVYINPYGGKQQGKRIYEQKVVPLLSRASISTHVIVTEHANHARDHLSTAADLKKYDGVVCVGGDGMFSEIVHGLLARTQRDCGVDQNCPDEKLVPCNIRIGIIPAACQYRPHYKSVSCDTASLTSDTGLLPPFTFSPESTSTPQKRMRDSSSYCPEGTDCSDNDARPSQETPLHTMKKYIVYEDNLLQLFKSCPSCNQRCTVEKHVQGTLLSITQTCTHCEDSSTWKSQPHIGKIAAGNLQLSAATAFTGSSFVQINKFLDAFNIQSITERTYHRHQRRFLHPTIYWQWKCDQTVLLQQAALDTDVFLGGDMRADTPGHCAKFGSYTMMDLKANRVIDLQLVQSNEVGNSQRMEKEGLVRSIALLEEANVQIKNFVTDRHPSIQKFLREEKPAIQHYYDVWHVAKGIAKKIDALAKVRNCQELGPWRKSIVNHLHWSCSSSSSGEETLAKWTSVANHVQNVHTHDNEKFSECSHRPLIGEDARQWLQPCTLPCERLLMLLMGNRLLKDVEKLSSSYQTSAIEAFHSLILRFAPKNVAFPFIGMLCRLLLAVMHYNENADRPQAASTSGELQYLIWFPKYKQGDYSVRPLKEKPTYVYTETLQNLLFQDVVANPEPYQELLRKVYVPPPLNSEYDMPDKAEAVARHRSRFAAVEEDDDVDDDEEVDEVYEEVDEVYEEVDEVYDDEVDYNEVDDDDDD